MSKLNKPNALASLVKYQRGTIVSREIIRKAKGTVTLFAFDKGQGLSEHTAPFDALVHVVDGKPEISIAAKKHRPRAGQMIILPANVSHALFARERFKMLLIMIRQ